MKYTIEVSLEDSMDDFTSAFDKLFDKMVSDGFPYAVIQRICDHFYWVIQEGFESLTITDGDADEGLYDTPTRSYPK